MIVTRGTGSGVRSTPKGAVNKAINDSFAKHTGQTMMQTINKPPVAGRIISELKRNYGLLKAQYEQDRQKMYLDGFSIGDVAVCADSGAFDVLTHAATGRKCVYVLVDPVISECDGTLVKPRWIISSYKGGLVCFLEDQSTEFVSELVCTRRGPKSAWVDDVRTIQVTKQAETAAA